MSAPNLLHVCICISPHLYVSSVEMQYVILVFNDIHNFVNIIHGQILFIIIAIM